MVKGIIKPVQRVCGSIRINKARKQTKWLKYKIKMEKKLKKQTWKQYFCKTNRE